MTKPAYIPLTLTGDGWTIEVAADGRVRANGEVNWDKAVEALKLAIDLTARMDSKAEASNRTAQAPAGSGE